jgi:hypothetical protein
MGNSKLLGKHVSAYLVDLDKTLAPAQERLAQLQLNAASAPDSEALHCRKFLTGYAWHKAWPCSTLQTGVKGCQQPVLLLL